jgi:hypothetical protein
MQLVPSAEGFSAFATFLGTPLPDDPIAALRRLRSEAEAEVERLLVLLDALDGEVDLEDQADDEDDGATEPSLASPESAPADQGRYVDTNGGGRFSNSLSQVSWARGNTSELEGDPSVDDEDGGDDEPSLGSYEVVPGVVMVDGNAIWPEQRQVRDSSFDGRESPTIARTSTTAASRRSAQRMPMIRPGGRAATGATASRTATRQITRTRRTRRGLPALPGRHGQNFKTGALNHSAISPQDRATRLAITGGQVHCKRPPVRRRRRRTGLRQAGAACMCSTNRSNGSSP